MQSIREAGDISGKRVLLRAPLNVPIDDNGEIFDDFRITRTIPTIKYLQNAGAKVIVISHLGRGGTQSIESVARELKSRTQGIEVLENLRQDPREVANDDSLAKELAELADIFVQDDFSVCHREHASVVGIPKFMPSYAGLLLEQEVTELTRALKPEAPSLFILGGAKFETKEPLIRKFLDLYDQVFIGGALANDFLKAKGFEVGTSLVSNTLPSEELLEHPSLVLPEQAIVRAADGSLRSSALSEVNSNEAIVDVFVGGENLAHGFKTITWNGPMGIYEDRCIEGTEHIARALAGMVNVDGTETIIGGGDTVAAVTKLGLQDSYTFVSTGGGAMLKFLLNGTLPGIEALG